VYDITVFMLIGYYSFNGHNIVIPQLILISWQWCSWLW